MVPFMLLTLVLGLALYNTQAHTMVNVFMPSSLHHEGGYSHHTGRFGQSPLVRAHYVGDTQYGSMSATVIPAGSDLCHHDDNFIATAVPFFLMAPRGNCTFVTKTRRAQHRGAAGLFIVDYEDSTGPVHVPDDGSGGDITIPAILLTNSDGKLITDKMASKTPVFMSLRWGPSNSSPKDFKKGDKVHYGMVLDMTDPHTTTLTQSLKHVALAVGKEASFRPTYIFYNGTKQDCVGKTGEGYCYQTCTNNGRYCVPHPNGKMVIQEIIHRWCIWKNHGDDKHDKKTGLEGEAWWNYVTYFDTNCAAEYFKVGKNVDDDDKCVKAAYKHARVKEQEVKDCMHSSGGADIDTDQPNELLDALLDAINEYGVHTTPQIWVANQTIPHYWSPPSATTMLRALCAAAGDAPKACTKCLKKNWRDSKEEDIINCAQKYYEDDNSHPRSHVWLALFSIVIAFGAAGGIVFWRRRDTTSGGGFASRLTSPLMNYMPLNNNGNADTTNNAHNISGIVAAAEDTVSFN